MVESAGEVADGETMTTPFGTPTLLTTAVVTPEQSGPMIATTPSAVIKRSATDVAAAESMQVESPRITTIVLPLSKLPDFDASENASSAPSAIPGAIDSRGPVNPRIIPILISSATTGIDNIASIVEVIRIFFISISLNGLIYDYSYAEFHYW